MTYRAVSIITITFITLVLGAKSFAIQTDETDRLQNLESWSQISATAERHNAPIVLLIEQRNCAFCQRLKREVFRPYANDASYFGRVLFASVLIDFDAPLIEKEGIEISGFEFAESLDASTTPTVLFLDHSANEVQSRIVGYIASAKYNRRFVDYIERSIQATSTEK